MLSNKKLSEAAALELMGVYENNISYESWGRLRIRNLEGSNEFYLMGNALEALGVTYHKPEYNHGTITVEGREAAAALAQKLADAGVNFQGRSQMPDMAKNA